MIDRWRDAAAYLIALENKDCSLEEFQFEQSKWLETSDEDIKGRLDLFRGSGAAKRLRKMQEFRWSKGTFSLKELHLRGGGQVVSRLLQSFKRENGRLWRVPEAAEAIQLEAKGTSKEGWDEESKRYLCEGTIPDFKRTLHIHTEERRKDLILGDGYHRAVIMWRGNTTEADCFFGKEV